MHENIFSLNNKHIVITGATGLVGSVLAEALSSFGARLTLVARDDKRLKSLQESLSASSSVECSTYALDLNSKQEVIDFLSTFSPDKNSVDGVVLCAMSRPAQSALDQYDELFEAKELNGTN